MADFVGSRISLVTHAGIRYEGILDQLDPDSSTVCLKELECYGTEDRPFPFVPKKGEKEAFMMFSGEDICDLTIVREVAEMNEEPKYEGQQLIEEIPQVPTYMNVNESYPQNPNYGMGNRNQNNNYSNQNYNRNYNDNYSGMNKQYNQNNNYNRNRNQNNQNQNNQNRRRGGNENRYYPNQNDHQNNQSKNNHVGELAAAENAAIKEKVINDFDFIASNEKFDKEDTQKIEPKYNKATSFFDTISCESLNKIKQKVDIQESKTLRDKQRAIDVETFGEANLPTGKGFGHRRRHHHYHNQNNRTGNQNNNYRGQNPRNNYRGYRNQNNDYSNQNTAQNN